MENPFRDQVIGVLRSALLARPIVRSAWLGGASAFGRVDEWSDIDLNMIVEDAAVAEAFDLVEESLEGLGGIDVIYEIPMPTWHGHAQRFYRLKNASPFLLIDVVVQRRSAGNRFLETEIHGEPETLFDHDGLALPAPFDIEHHEEALAARRQRLPILFDLFQVFVLKELNRGNDIEALSFYHGFTLRPLVEALRILHSPHRFSFQTRHIQYDLPPEIVERVRDLFFVRDGEDLRRRLVEAGILFEETMERLRR